ncbi:hypothetical protein [Zhihengliuella halotolerans]|uniref:hypothetical protein n=1 Tax=Zhihengliuella halotolerans TaxID=370736 RepID=UPI000C8088D1|nr:hypothetical protein [Zhihengliuella halotolerans]
MRQQVDHFIGGPLDGSVRPFDPTFIDQQYDPVSGTLYVRQASMDTDIERVWVPASGRTPVDDIAVTAKAPARGVTLDQLERFVRTARQFGFPDDAEPIALVTFRGRLKTLGLKNTPKVPPVAQ